MVACEALGVRKMGRGRDQHLRPPTLGPGARGSCPESYTGEACSSHALAEDHPPGPQPRRDSAGLREVPTQSLHLPSCARCLPTLPGFASHMPQATFDPVQASPWTPPSP